MEKWIDLHTHSTASDGSMTPEELVRHAKSQGLAAIALTDHDTMDGIEEALAEGERIGLEVIPGVEISVEFKPEMHILGYFFHRDLQGIQEPLGELRANREERNPKIIRKLNEMGFDLTMAEVEAEAKGSVVGRPHIARVLVNKGYIKSLEAAFDKYLGSGRPAYFKKDKLTPEEGIGMIRRNGGVPVLAHPIFLQLGFSALDELLGRLVQAGLMGVETYYSDHYHEYSGKLLRLLIKHQLLATGGSDFHGTFKNDIAIGKGRGNLQVPYELLEKMKTRISSGQK